eukprot:TRINITY_DN25056_c0_g1_i1.p1 TRINITY_DN25056_c0_g1~~TRINITY_DN25056_c0_g1_i1.p1  ORF type:complete len:356 (-),score=34.53 TRINITY_DN25056_c0_g1_i1:8-1075(-)
MDTALLEDLRSATKRSVIIALGPCINADARAFNLSALAKENASSVSAVSPPGGCLSDALNSEKFAEHPEPFLALCRAVWPTAPAPTHVHNLIQWLHRRSLLLRVYTQCVDGSESLARLPSALVVRPCGTFAAARCSGCGADYDAGVLRRLVMATPMSIAVCEHCGSFVRPDLRLERDVWRDSFEERWEKDRKRAHAVVFLGVDTTLPPFCDMLRACEGSRRWAVVLRNFASPGDFVRRLVVTDVARASRRLLAALQQQQEEQKVQPVQRSASKRKRRDSDCHTTDLTRIKGLRSTSKPRRRLATLGLPTPHSTRLRTLAMHQSPERSPVSVEVKAAYVVDWLSSHTPTQLQFDED